MAFPVGAHVTSLTYWAVLASRSPPVLGGLKLITWDNISNMIEVSWSPLRTPASHLEPSWSGRSLQMRNVSILVGWKSSPGGTFWWEKLQKGFLEERETYLQKICSWPGESEGTGCDWRPFSLRRSTHHEWKGHQTEYKWRQRMMPSIEEKIMRLIWRFQSPRGEDSPCLWRESLCLTPMCHWKRLGKTCTWQFFLVVLKKFGMYQTLRNRRSS